jgi:SAM-dependent methyltransferase
MTQKSSYQWWQNNGSTWIEEIEYRKSNQLYYHIQELLLLDYFHNSKFNRVLEFGCGFGRHLRYLREIPNLEVFGYDQSESIVSSISTWAEPEWVAKYIKIGHPNGSLPYPDKYFDAVFTTSVMIHIPPEDVVGIMKELTRVSKYQIIHQEPAPDYEVYHEAHDGCWNHNLVDIYQSIGYSCEILESAFEIQRFYRVLIGNNPGNNVYTPSSLLLKKLSDFENSIQSSLNAIIAERDSLCQQHENWIVEKNDLVQKFDNLILERDHLVHQSDRLIVERNDLYRQCEQLTQERNDLLQHCKNLTIEQNNITQLLNSCSTELNEIVNSRTWKTILSIKSNKYIKATGYLTFNFIQASKQLIKPQLLTVEQPQANLNNAAFDDIEMLKWLESFKQQGKSILVVYVPHWLGINSATKNMFSDCYAIPEYLNEEQSRYYAKLLIEAGVKHFISAGCGYSHIEVIKALKKFNTNIRCDVTWHGSSIQNYEDYNWNMLTQAIELAKQDIIYKLGFAKKGMEKSFQAMNLRAEFLPNFVNSIPASANVVNSRKPELGIWISWTGYRKLPYAMIAAVHLISDANLNMAGVGERAKQWADMLGVPVNFFSPNPIPREELHERIKNTHLSLYLTSSECAPMLPIESLSLGVPCLISPVSHWFEDDEYLHSRLVVPYPERPEVIAEYIKQAIEEREQIIHRYKIYAERYNLWAKQQVQKFLYD